MTTCRAGDLALQRHRFINVDGVLLGLAGGVLLNERLQAAPRGHAIDLGTRHGELCRCDRLPTECAGLPEQGYRLECAALPKQGKRQNVPDCGARVRYRLSCRW